SILFLSHYITYLFLFYFFFFFFSSRRRHTRSYGDWSSDVCSSDLPYAGRKKHKRHPHYPRAVGVPGRQAGHQRRGIGSLSGRTRSEERRVGKECRSRWGREE